MGSPLLFSIIAIIRAGDNHQPAAAEKETGKALRNGAPIGSQSFGNCSLNRSRRTHSLMLLHFTLVFMLIVAKEVKVRPTVICHMMLSYQ